MKSNNCGLSEEADSLESLPDQKAELVMYWLLVAECLSDADSVIPGRPIGTIQGRAPILYEGVRGILCVPVIHHSILCTLLAESSAIFMPGNMHRTIWNAVIWP